MPWIWNGSAELDAMSNYPIIIGAVTAAMVVMLLVVGLRAYVRAYVLRDLDWDDYIIFISAAGIIAFVGGAILQTRAGLGLPPKHYPPENVVTLKLLNYKIRWLYLIPCPGFKVALCFAYLRITTNSSLRRYRQVIWGAMAMSIIVHLFQLGVVLFQCMPIHKQWNSTIPGQCLSFYVSYVLTSVQSISMDVFLFFLPIPLILRLQMSVQRKIGLSSAFLFGLFTTVCSIMRLIESFRIKRTGDAQWLVMWSVLEVNVGVITTSIPTLAPLLKRARRTISNRRDNSKYHTASRAYNNGSGNIKLGHFGKQIGSFDASKRRLTNGPSGPAMDQGYMTRENGYSSEEEILADAWVAGSLEAPTVVEEESGDTGKEITSSTWPEREAPGIFKTTNVQVSSDPRSRQDEGTQETKQRATMKSWR